MKRMLPLLLIALLAAFVLAGCGSNKDDPSITDDAVTGDTDTNTGDGTGGDSAVQDPDRDGMDESAAADGTAKTTNTTAAHGTGTVYSDRTVRSTSTKTDGTRAVVRGATYEQMLRNGYVHDTDGDLHDHENAVTPGTVY